MASEEQIGKWRRALNATFPMVGRIRRRGAMSELEAHRDEAEVVPLLVEALGSGDTEVAARADAALRDLHEGVAVDALCAAWAKGRDERLGRMIVERGYVAAKPVGNRLLSALKCGKRVAAESAGIVRRLVALLADPDETVRKGAERDLRACEPGAGQDALCEVAIAEPTGRAARLCVQTGKRHSDHEKYCMYLFVTRQLEAYFEEDFEFQALRLEYDRSDAAVQGHVMDVVRSGDRRCAGFIQSGGRTGGVGAKPLAECTEQEIETALHSWLRHGQWDRLFGACLELPLKHSWSLLEPLSKSGWEPEAADLQSVFKQVLADGAGKAIPEQREPSAESSLFERWLAEGAKPSGGEAALLGRLDSAEPADAVAAVSALAAKARPRSAAAKQVAESPHWLVRLAGQASGLTLDLATDAPEDANWWVKELSTASAVLDFWPGRATPADLEALSKAPREAWAGRLGAARKVLRSVIGHRVTTGTFEPMVVEADEFAGEFVAADDAEFVSEPPQPKKGTKR